MPCRIALSVVLAFTLSACSSFAHYRTTEMAEAPSPFHNTEAYDRIDESGFFDTLDQPLSTFAADVDTAAYSNVRRFLTGGELPPKDAVRIEELINYFTYDYPRPAPSETVAIVADAGPCPWNDAHELLRIGIAASANRRGPPPAKRFVFLVDVSGSMSDENKLPLLKRSLTLLTERLDERDRIGMVVYAGASGVVLRPTSDKDRIITALKRLEAGGSTNGASGIELAYKLAEESFEPGAMNRVILATDGDFNVGVTNQGDLLRLIEEKRKTGVFLSVLGFGMGNYKDATLEKLADRGNGHYAYIDTLEEAKKVLVDEGAALETVAKDVKIQVEMNPAVVKSYRLVGYENRRLENKDFKDDTKDAGDMGEGQTVTALYEIVRADGSDGDAKALKYQTPRKLLGHAHEMATVRVRYKDADKETSKLVETTVSSAAQSFAAASADYRFASAVAAWGMVLRDSSHKGSATPQLIKELANSALGNDPRGLRREFLTLVAKAERFER